VICPLRQAWAFHQTVTIPAKIRALQEMAFLLYLDEMTFIRWTKKPQGRGDRLSEVKGDISKRAGSDEVKN
jgi:hypothetical protein